MSTSVLFVCLGNICRSPLAEGIMLHLNEKHDLNWTIDSAGTAGYHVGEAPDPRTIKNARKNGVDLTELRARQFTVSDFEKFDHIFVMDQSNRRNVLQLASEDGHREKVKLFLDYALDGEQTEVPDPWYGDEAGFENVFQLVKNGCEQLVRKMR